MTFLPETLREPLVLRRDCRPTATTAGDRKDPNLSRPPKTGEISSTLHPAILADRVILHHAGEAFRKLLEEAAARNPRVAVALATPPPYDAAASA